jgi:hypothetical protein
MWDSLKTITTDAYEIKIPFNWRHLQTDEYGLEHYIEASGKVLPQEYNNEPVRLSIHFLRQSGNGLENCKENCLKEYNTNPDRKFPKNFNHIPEKVKLVSGQTAYFIYTRFHHKTTLQNQSRFDLVLFSDKLQTGYAYTISVKYADDEYNFESDNNLVEFARQLFSYVELKD